MIHSPSQKTKGVNQVSREALTMIHSPRRNEKCYLSLS